MDGMKREACLATIDASTRPWHRHFLDPGKKDGRCTQGLAIPKSNGARHRRAAVRGLRGDLCITFTFGGLRVDADCCVSTRGPAHQGPHAAGEMVGGCSISTIPAAPASCLRPCWPYRRPVRARLLGLRLRLRRRTVEASRKLIYPSEPRLWRASMDHTGRERRP